MCESRSGRQTLAIESMAFPISVLIFITVIVPTKVWIGKISGVIGSWVFSGEIKNSILIVMLFKRIILTKILVVRISFIVGKHKLCKFGSMERGNG